MQVQPYLFFNGRCEEALAFYGEAVGAKVEMLMRFKDSPEPPSADCTPSSGDNVMHASFRIGDSVLMASDGNADTPEFKGFSLSLAYPTPEEAKRVFDALAAEGQVIMPLGKTFFAPSFGMLVDRFGMSWMVLAMA